MISEKDFYYKKNRLNQVKGFCSVVENSCCVSEAARKINMEQTTISKQIIALERDLGVQLFDRSTHKKLKLSEDGDIFYKEAVKQLNGINSLFDNFNNNLKEFKSSYLNIGSHYTAATYIFPDIIGKLLKQENFKNINIKITELSKNEAIRRLEDRVVDLIYCPFGVNDEIPDKFDALKSIKSNHALILSKNHPLVNKDEITIEDLNKYDFLVRGRNISLGIDDHLNLKHSNIYLENCSMDTSVELVVSTNGMTAIPRIIFESGNLKYNPNIVCKNISHLFQETYFQAITLKNSIPKESVKFILDELEKLPH